MAALKEKGIALLGSATLTMTTGVGGTIFTVPVGKVARITHVVFRDPSATMAAATAVSVNGFRGAANFSLANLSTANTGYLVALVVDLGQSLELAAGTAVALTITTGAAAGTCVVDVFGYLTN